MTNEVLQKTASDEQNVSSSNGLEPKIRFPEFNENYKTINLSEYLFENKDRNKSEIYSKQDVLSVSGEFGIVNQIKLQGRSFAGESVKEYHIVETNDIVYTKSPLKANPYGIIKVNKGIPGIVSTLYAVYHVKNTAFPEYIDYYFSNNLRLNKYLKPLVNIGAKHDMKVNNETVLIGCVTFPKVEEQQKIANFLYLIDQRIEKQRLLVESLKKYKRGLLSAIFDRKLRFKDKNGNDYPEWENKKISDIFKLTRGYVLATSEISELQTSEFKYPVYSSQTKNEGLLGYYNKSLYKNAITWTTDGANAGYVKFRKGDFYCTNVCGVLLCNKGNCNTYIAEKLNSVTKRHVSYVGNPKLMNNGMAEICIDFPSIQEQTVISKLLTQIDERIKTANFLYERIILLKQGLLQQMFI